MCDDLLMHQLQTISSQRLPFIFINCNGVRQNHPHQLSTILLYHSGIAQAETVLSLLCLSSNSISRGRSQGCNHQLRLDSKFKRLKKSGLSGSEKEKGRCSSQVFSSCRVIDSLMWVESIQFSSRLKISESMSEVLSWLLGCYLPIPLPPHLCVESSWAAGGTPEVRICQLPIATPHPHLSLPRFLSPSSPVPMPAEAELTPQLGWWCISQSRLDSRLRYWLNSLFNHKFKL